MERPEPECAPVEKLETEDLFNRLRNHLQELPEVEQQIIAFHYGAGINQSQIAKMLSIPKQTVSYKLQEALGRLRSSLTAAGFGAAVPLLNAEGLSKAILTGHEVPPGLTERVMSRIANADKGIANAVPHRAMRRVATAKSANTALLIGGAIVGAIGVAGVLWYGKKPEPPKQSSQPASVPSAPAEAKPLNEPGLLAHWTFEAGIPKDFKLHNGEWRWEKPQDDNPGSIAFLADFGKPSTVFILPVTVPLRPFMAVAKVRSIQKPKDASVGFCWFTGTKLVTPQKEILGKRLDTASGIMVKTFFLGKFSVILLNDSVLNVSEYKESFPATHIIINGNNTAVESIEVRELKPEEIPEDMRDPEALFKKLEAKEKNN